MDADGLIKARSSDLEYPDKLFLNHQIPRSHRAGILIKQRSVRPIDRNPESVGRPVDEDGDEPEAGRPVDCEGPGDRRDIFVDIDRGDQAGNRIDVQLCERIFDPAGQFGHARLVATRGFLRDGCMPLLGTLSRH